jgi:hypothetical protein
MYMQSAWLLCEQRTCHQPQVLQLLLPTAARYIS